MVKLLAKLLAHDLGIPDDVFRLAVGYFLATDQHNKTLRETHDRAHDVLDEDDRDAALIELLQKREDVLNFRVRKASHRFVGNQQFRLGGDGPREFEFAHFDLRQVARHMARFVVKPDQPQEFDAAGVNVVAVQRTGALVYRVQHRHAQVIGEVEAHERAGELEAPRQPAMRALMGSQSVHSTAVKMHAALFVLQGAADAVHQGAFARTIRADQAETLARLHFKLDAIERDKASEALADVADVQQRAHLPSLRARRRSWTSPTRPLGAITTNATSKRPTISRFTAEEIVTVAICCSEPSRMAPITGPTQLVVPPMIGMAMELTPYSSPKAEAGCR